MPGFLYCALWVCIVAEPKTRDRTLCTLENRVATVKESVLKLNIKNCRVLGKLRNEAKQ